MNFVTMFFKSMRLASELDHNYRVDGDPARTAKLIDELGVDAQASRKGMVDRQRAATGSVPHPA